VQKHPPRVMLSKVKALLRTGGAMREDLRPVGRARNGQARANSDEYGPIADMVMAARTARSRLFPRFMFGEPAWDVLLLLYRDGNLSVADLARSSDTPLSTTGRWIDSLEDHELVKRMRCGDDRGEDRIELSDRARGGLQSFLSALAGNWPVAAATD